KPAALAPIVELMAMPELEPDKPEISDDEQSRNPNETNDLAPPKLADVPTLAPVDAFLQQVEPPPPPRLNKTTSTFTIPAVFHSAPTSNLTNIFDLKNLDRVPSPRFQAKPIYPFEMRRAGIEGEVLVGFIVDAEGNVRDAYSVRASQREFETPAVQAVSKWKFRPGQKGGKAVNTRMQVPIIFSISPD
ncbi:MAG TPA: TonB family protein, partial [Opitutaceae bacterium]|nr:TonB family protein [Opitutaceae bacterium]